MGNPAFKARAIENQACMIGVNRVGNDQELEYGGRSMIISPTGEILADASDETVVMHSMIQETKGGMEKYISCRSGISGRKIKVKIFILRTREILEDLPFAKILSNLLNSSAENSVCFADLIFSKI